MENYKEITQLCCKFINEQKWEEAIKLVDKNISRFKSPREKNGVNCLQFYNAFDLVFYQKLNPDEKFNIEDSVELCLLYYKSISLRMLNKWNELENCLNLAFEITYKENPTLNFLLITKLEKEKQFDKVVDLLDKIYPYVWKYTDFCNYLIHKSLCYTYTTHILKSKSMTSWAMEYSKFYATKKNFDLHLSRIAQDSPNGKVIMPSPVDVLKGLKNEKLFPSQNGLQFALKAYLSTIPKKQVNQENAQKYTEAKENFAKMFYQLASITLKEFKPQDTRILDLDEILDPQKYIRTNFEEKGLMPFIDVFDNDFICYDLLEECWCKYNIVEEVKFSRTKNIYVLFQSSVEKEKGNFSEKELIDFVTNNDVVFSKNTINENEIKYYEKIIGLTFGKQLQQYILNYGFLSFGSLEFYGINAVQKEKSDLVVQTNYLHNYFEKTKCLIAFESFGDGFYVLVDEKDNVFEYDNETDKLTNLKIMLNDYILKRFKEKKENDF